MLFLRTSVITFLLCFAGFALGYAQEQTELQKRVERYLYASFTANKASMKENERILSFLEEKLDLYITKQENKETLARIKKLEKECDALIKQIDQQKDPVQLLQMVEESKKSSRGQLDQFFSEGLQSIQDVVPCRRLIIMKTLEYYLLQEKHDKLMALLKDDFTRQEFINELLNKGKINENSDLRKIAQTVEVEVTKYNI